MTTDTKIKSPREDLAASLARYDQMLDAMFQGSESGIEVDAARAIIPALLVSSGLALVVRALLIGSDEVASAIADLDPHQL